MKKFLMMAALVLALVISCSACMAEAGLPENSWVRDSVEGTVWVDDRASLEVIQEEDCCRVLIVWGSSAWETTEWTYTCAYDAENDRLVASHVICANIVYDDEGNDTRTVVLDRDCETVFAMNEQGQLVITNAADETLEGKAFETMPVENTEY